MSALEKLIENADVTGLSNLVVAARVEHAELITALDWALLRVGDTSYDALKNPEKFKAEFQKAKQLVERLKST